MQRARGISVKRKRFQKMILIANGTLLCILFIPFCLLFAAICVILTLTDHIFAKIEKQK